MSMDWDPLKPTVKFEISPWSIGGKSGVGASISYSFGWNYKVSTNPVGLLGQLGGTIPIPVIGVVAGLLGGDVGFNVGAGVKFNYGPSYSFSYGRKVDFDPTSSLVKIPAHLLASAISLSNLAGTILSSNKVFDPPKDMKEWIATPECLGWSLPVLCLAALTMIQNTGYTATKLKLLKDEQEKEEQADTARRLQATVAVLSYRIHRIEDVLKQQRRRL
jgi:hypothetical protein